MQKRKGVETATPVLLLTIPQVAAALSLGRTKVYELIKCDSLPTVEVDGFKPVSVSSLHRWIEENETQGVA